MMAKFFCLLLAIAASAAAQTVEGAVTNVVTGGGIAGAKVVLQQGEKTDYSATTDAEGHFSIAGVADGAYSVRYSAVRYFNPASGPSATPRVQVTAGVPVRLAGRMIPLSRISGRVIDTRGDPVVKARVELTTASAFFRAETDAKGNFELDSVIPGNFSYTLYAAPPLEWKPPTPDPDTHQPRGWMRTYYPGVGFREDATPVVVQAGRDLLGLEIKLLAVPMHAVRGVLLSPDGGPVSKAAISLWEIGPRRDAAYHAESKLDGSFEFAAVVDGEWRLSAAFKSGEVQLLSSEWIAMKGREIEGVKLRLSPPFRLSGKVILETTQGMSPPAAPEVILIKQHAGQMLFDGPSILSVSPERDGRFRFEDLYPGTYRISSAIPPPPFYMDAMRLGTAPIVEEVELSGDAPELTIVYKTNGGTVRGTVENCGAGQVWLVSQDTQNRRLFGTCDAAAFGPSRFEIAAVPPGEYYALAVAGHELWSRPLDAAFLQKALRLTVRAGETTQATLSLSASR